MHRQRCVPSRRLKRTTNQRGFWEIVYNVSPSILTAKCSRSAVVDDLEEASKGQREVGVVYFYWKHGLQQTMTVFMSSLLKQVSCSRKTLYWPLKQFYDQVSHRRPKPEPQDLPQLQKLFFDLSNDTFKTLSILLDGLDECAEKTLPEVTTFIQTCLAPPSTTNPSNKILSSNPYNIKVLAASRPNRSEVKELLGLTQTIHIEIEAHENDITNFLKRQMECPTLKLVAQCQKDDIIAKVGQGVKGMFSPTSCVLTR
jgi:hypothetical protein